ncbi:echinoderm microtubule-associated protein-like 6 [Pollicipes pollicipes]|uniref:echinoderm microtubule-associated protein-like 6 n=1 Tax=Pollicipes pollicipes TaxID=41117 RepID=UPI0018849020|nr:echinoderm microtubule-associated protein-like 6 [Pollicipes pollicipes]
MTARAPPDASLRLEWIFGYNGVAMKNVHFLAKNIIVYFTAGVGVVFRLAEKDQKYFHGHNDDITSLAVSPDKTKVATGQLGDEPYICVWHPFTLETLSVLKDAHLIGIKRLGFSLDGKMLASLGMDDSNTLVVWDWQRGTSVASTTGHSARVLDLTWSPYTANELATCGDHHLRLWHQLGNSFKSHGAVFGAADLVQNLTCVLYQSETTLVTGTEHGHVYVWRNRELYRVIDGTHDSAVLCLALARDGLVTGGEDGHVKLWTAHYDPSKTVRARSPALNRDGAVTSVVWEHGQFLIGTRLSEIFVHHDADSVCYMQGHGKGELWGLCPHVANYLVVTAGEDHTVRVWDVEKREALQATRLDLEVMACAVRPDSSQIAVGMKYGTVAILRSGDMSEVTRISDRKEAISDLKFSPDGSRLAVGSHDNFVDVYETERYRRKAELAGASSYISHLDWSMHGDYVQLNSGAGERLVFAAHDGSRVTDQDVLDSLEWHTLTGVLGPEIHGIWPRYSDLTDINTADVDVENGVIATGDDFGLVKLFRYPCRKKGENYDIGDTPFPKEMPAGRHGCQLISL